MIKLNIFIKYLFGFIIFCCLSDNNQTQKTITSGELIVNGKTYDLTHGIILPNFKGSDPNFAKIRFDMIILSNGNIAIENDNFIYSDNLTQFVGLNLVSPVSDSKVFENTKFMNYNANKPISNLNRNKPFIDGDVINTNAVFKNTQYVSSDYFMLWDFDGHAEITEIGGIYTISFSFSNSENMISGSFKGKLTELHYQY